MKIINFIKTHLAKLASMAAALVLTAHVFVPAVNIMADNETKNINVAFSTNNEKVEVILNGTTLVKGDTNNIEYLENASTLSLTVKAPYDSVITTLNASDRWGESTSLLDDTFPSAATMADIWKATDSYYIITKDFDIKYLIQSGPNIKPETIAIETTPSGFTTSSLAQSYKHVTPTFISATHGETSYPLTATEDGSLESTTFPTGTKLSFSLATDEHYENPTVKFNDAVVTPENGTYTITLSDATNNLQVSASPILGSITAVAAHGSTSLDLSEKYLEGTTVSFTVDCNDDKYYVDTVTANGETLTPNDNEEYSFTIHADENTIVVNYAAYEQIDIAAETNEGTEPSDNDSAATEKVKDLLTILAPVEQEITDSIANLRAAIKKAQSVSVALKSKKISISNTDANQFQKIAAAAEDNYKIAGYYDINLKLTVKKSSGNATHHVEKLNSNMTVKLDISDLTLPKVPNNYTRKFAVIRGHTYGGTTTATIIEDVTVNGNILTFPTDSFSTYAVVYTDIFDTSLLHEINYSDLGLATINFISAAYDGTTYTDPTKCELFTWGATSATFPEGTKLIFDLKPADDYKLTDVNVTGTELDTGSESYSLTVGNQDIAISATTERKSSTFSLGATNGTINFLGATYKNAAGTTETYGTDYTDPAYTAPFCYDKDHNTLTLPLGASVSFSITPDDGYYVANVAYTADDDKESTIAADEDGIYTFTLDEHTSSFTVSFGKTVITYSTSIKDTKADGDLALYVLDKNLNSTKKFYDIDYIKTITEGEKVTNIPLTSSDEPIDVTVDAGTFAPLKTSYTRTFTVLHKDTDGNIQPLSATHNSEDNTITFSTDSFGGKFTVAYIDTYDESLVSVLDFSGVSDGTIISFVQATYGGNVYNKLPTSDEAFSWTSARATFPVGTVVYFTVTGDKDHDLGSVSLNGIALSADSDTNHYTFNAESTGIYVLSTTTSRKTATLDTFVDHGTATITSATYNGTDVTGHLVAGTTVIVTITPESGYTITTTSTTGITAVAEVSKNVYSLTLSGGTNTFTVNLTATSSEDDPGNGSDDPGDNPGNGGETDPGTGSGSGTGTGSGSGGGTIPGGSISTPEDPTDSFAPIGGGIQAPSDANSEYFLPEDENGVIRNPNPLKNLTATLSKLTVGKNQLTVKLAKVKNATGYQIVYRVKGTTTWKTTTTTSLTKTIKSLKKGKKYEVKTRAYKKVSGQTFYSKWSTVKTSAKIK